MHFDHDNYNYQMFVIRDQQDLFAERKMFVVDSYLLRRGCYLALINHVTNYEPRGRFNYLRIHVYQTARLELLLL